MTDLIYILVFVVFFGLCLLYARGCARLCNLTDLLGMSIGLVLIGRRSFKRRNEIHGDLPQITRKFCVRAPYMTNILRVLDPNGLAPVILSASWWALPSSNARELYHEEYNNIMGYPHDYDWGKFKPKFREFLSRGVIPAVAQWILENVSANLVGRNGHGGAGELRKCFPGHIIDFSPPTKGSLLEAA